MSHDDSRRAACDMTIGDPRFHSAVRKVARGVTDVGVGSGALFGRAGTCMTGLKKREIHAGDSGPHAWNYQRWECANTILRNTRYDTLPGMADALDLKLTSRRETCSEPPYSSTEAMPVDPGCTMPK
jgi:hypothetical protein